VTRTFKVGTGDRPQGLSGASSRSPGSGRPRLVERGPIPPHPFAALLGFATERRIPGGPPRRPAFGSYSSWVPGGPVVEVSWSSWLAPPTASAGTCGRAGGPRSVTPPVKSIARRPNPATASRAKAMANHVGRTADIIGRRTGVVDSQADPEESRRQGDVDRCATGQASRSDTFSTSTGRSG
jgi:hypothetical protein